MLATYPTQSETPTQAALSMPNILLRLEGLVLLVGAVALYAHLGGSAIVFIALLFVPDVSMVGYLRNPRTGSLVYNAVHTYLLPALLAALSLAFNLPVGLQIALIWFAHIGMDRIVGFGLKYPTEFKDTHFQRV